MNKQQRDYAAQRVHAIKGEKIAAIKERHTVKGVKLSNKERAAAFKAGRFTVVAGLTEIHSYTDVVNAVKFTDETPTKIADKKIAAESAKVEAKATAILDELMLGDAEAALTLINKFAK